MRKGFEQLERRQKKKGSKWNENRERIKTNNQPGGECTGERKKKKKVKDLDKHKNGIEGSFFLQQCENRQNKRKKKKKQKETDRDSQTKQEILEKY